MAGTREWVAGAEELVREVRQLPYPVLEAHLTPASPDPRAHVAAVAMRAVPNLMFGPLVQDALRAARRQLAGESVGHLCGLPILDIRRRPEALVLLRQLHRLPRRLVRCGGDLEQALSDLESWADYPAAGLVVLRTCTSARSHMGALS